MYSLHPHTAHAHPAQTRQSGPAIVLPSPGRGNLSHRIEFSVIISYSQAPYDTSASDYGATKNPIKQRSARFSSKHYAPCILFHTFDCPCPEPKHQSCHKYIGISIAVCPDMRISTSSCHQVFPSPSSSFFDVLLRNKLSRYSGPVMFSNSGWQNWQYQVV